MIGMGWLRRITRGRKLGRGDSGELGGLCYHFSILMVGVNWKFWIRGLNDQFPFLISCELRPFATVEAWTS